MFIQRRPGFSTISARGSSSRGASTTSAGRRRRPMRGFGRLGMTRRLLGYRQHGPTILPGKLVGESHQEGWRDWPDETPPTGPQGTRWQLQQANTYGLGDAVG